MAKFKVELEINIDGDLLQYVDRQGQSLPQSMLNGYVKNQLSLDILDALRLYGVNAQIQYVSKINR
jgi:hypothetical protein